MKTFLKITFFSIALYSFSIHALHTATAVGISTVTGVGIGFMGYKSAKMGSNVIERVKKVTRVDDALGDLLVLKPEVLAVTTGIPAACATYARLHRYTPRGRYTYVQSVLKKAEHALLARVKLTKEHEAHILRRSGYLIGGESIPYVHACRALGELDTELRYALKDIRSIERQATAKSALHAECARARKKIRFFDEIISHNLGYFQLTDPKLFADLLKADAQLQQAHAQENMAHAQTSMARSQTSQEVRGWVSLVGKFGDGLGSKIVNIFTNPSK